MPPIDRLHGMSGAHDDHRHLSPLYVSERNNGKRDPALREKDRPHAQRKQSSGIRIAARAQNSAPEAVAIDTIESRGSLELLLFDVLGSRGSLATATSTEEHPCEFRRVQRKERLLVNKL